jgi:hypothetical protein
MTQQHGLDGVGTCMERRGGLERWPKAWKNAVMAALLTWRNLDRALQTRVVGMGFLYQCHGDANLLHQWGTRSQATGRPTGGPH